MRTFLMLGLAAALGLSVACSHNEEKVETTAPAATTPAVENTTAPALTTPDTTHDVAPVPTDDAKPKKASKKKKKAQ